jgi:RNA polymerase-binding transcription factor DksA
MDERRARERLARERDRVEQERAALRDGLAERETEAIGDIADYDQHQPDRATETYERERDEGRLLELEDRRQAIDRALRRLDEGTYGVSAVTGLPIPDERLDAIPWAERTTEEEARAMQPQTPRPDPTAATDPDDDREEPRPPDLATIPLSRDFHDRVDDPQQRTGRVDPHIPGEVYPTENDPPHVGQPEPGDRLIPRHYRPQSRPPDPGRGARETIQLLIDSGVLEPAPRVAPAETAPLMRRAKRHLESTKRLADQDPDGALAGAWLSSRHALHTVLRVDGLRLRTLTRDDVAAYAEAALPDVAALAVAELEESHELMSTGALEVGEQEVRRSLARAQRVVAAAELEVADAEA